MALSKRSRAFAEDVVTGSVLEELALLACLFALVAGLPSLACEVSTQARQTTSRMHLRRIVGFSQRIDSATDAWEASTANSSNQVTERVRLPVVRADLHAKPKTHSHQCTSRPYAP